MHISIILFFGFLIGVAAIGFLAGYFISSLFRDMERRDVEMLERILATLQILSTLIDQLDVQTAQNIFFAISKETYAKVNEKASSGDVTSKKWIESFRSLAQYLNVNVE